jgi:hypothetical protein
MFNAHSSANNTSGASLELTGLTLFSVPIADSSSDNLVCASFTYASFVFVPMPMPMPDAHPSFLDNISTPISRAYHVRSINMGLPS